MPEIAPAHPTAATTRGKRQKLHLLLGADLTGAFLGIKARSE